MSMAGPLTGADDKSGSGTTKVEDVDGGPPWGVLAACSAAATTKVEDVNGGPLGVLVACPEVTTTEVEDINGGPSRGCW
jgi:hypothetical protein